MKRRVSQSLAALAVTIACGATAIPATASPTARHPHAQKMPMAWLCAHYPSQTLQRGHGCG
jgi:hypothetical protein